MHLSLRDFVSQARATGRIRFADMRRLKRDVLPVRLTTCEEAEALIALDRELQSADPDWRDYLVLMVRDFVVWGLEPIGSVDRTKAEWLVPILSSNGMTKTGRLIAREVVREAWNVDEILACLAPRNPKRRHRDEEEEHDLQIDGLGSAESSRPPALLPAPQVAI